MTDHKKAKDMSGAITFINARETLGLKKSEMARLINKDPSYISRVESGKQSISEELEAFSAMVTKLIAPPSTVTPADIIATISEIPLERRRGYTINLAVSGLLSAEDKKELLGQSMNSNPEAYDTEGAPDMLSFKNHLEDLKERAYRYSKNASPEVFQHLKEMVHHLGIAADMARYTAESESRNRSENKEDSGEGLSE